jgi:hypothetical protein
MTDLIKELIQRKAAQYARDAKKAKAPAPAPAPAKGKDK